MRTIAKHMFGLGVAAAAAFALSACGGGGAGSAGSTAAISTGTMAKGSVIVNGVKFAAAAGAKVRADDNAAATEAELRDGMEVKVKGRINDDRVNGQFDAVEAEPRVRGEMTGKGADDFTVHNHHVVTDDNTVFEDRSAGGVFTKLTNGIDDLADLDEVEVHGGLDDLGNVRATRVERRHDDPNDEVRGIVTARIDNVITIGTLFSIDISGVPTSPPGQAVNVGDLVEVHLNAAGTAATLVDIEDLEDAEFEPAEGQEFEVEGFISGFTAHPGTYEVGGQIVRTTSATTFRNGTATDLDNNVKVEAEGHFDNVALVLTADKIQFKHTRIILEGSTSNVTAMSFTLLGKTVKITSATQGSVTARVQVRGFEDAAGNIVAERIEDKPPGGNPRDLIQARVTAENGTTSLTLLGIVFTADAGAEYRDVNDNPITAAAFFAQVTPKSATNPGTLVKLRLTAGTTTYIRAELQDED